MAPKDTGIPVQPTNAPSLHRLPFPARRSAVMGLGPMVATSQPLAAQAGLQVLLAGGSACDAAVATAAVLAVVEPTGTGLGGDCFALAYASATATVRALNGSGRSASALDLATLHRLGLARMPERGALTVTVPGAVHAWATLLTEHGRMSLAEVLAPAIAIAERGYPVSEIIAAAWASSASLLARSQAASEHFLPAGRPPNAGEIIRLPGMAGALRAIAEGGTDAFYRGPIADAIVEACTAGGGYLSHDDLAGHTSAWASPIRTTYYDLDVWECPPNGQGLAALLALAIARDLDVGAAPWGSPDHLHLLIEAMRLAFADVTAWVADPESSTAPVDTLLSKGYIDARRALIQPHRALAAPGTGILPTSDTVYIAVVDGDGNACSLINSNYMGFGSGIVAGWTGIPLQNRGAGFVLDAGHPNAYAPHKRPYHTIIPGLATRSSDNSLYACFGVMGGHMQPQGHLQVLTNLKVYGMDPQRAVDAPRFQILPAGDVALEPWFSSVTRRELVARGHGIVPRAATPAAASFGGGQVIAVTEDGVRIGGSDPRKDGAVAAA